MLDHILATTQAFEREHGIAPNVVYLNTTHFNALRATCPGLFKGDDTTRLGIQLVIVTDSMLMHPRAACLPGAPGASGVSDNRMSRNDDCATG